MGTLGVYQIILFSDPASSAKFLNSGYCIFGGASISIYDPNIATNAYNGAAWFGYVMSTDQSLTCFS